MELRNLFTRKKGLNFAIIVLSISIFLIIYGTNVINPFYTSWLYDCGELSQHYLGWVAYRKSAWHFPIGLVDNLAYPNLTSVIFTDSIPLFAVVFKILDPLLPSEFQYMGIWGVMCFVLQSIFASKILKEYTDNVLSIIIGSMLSLMSPIVFFRMFGHTALAGQWIILLGLELLLSKRRNKTISLYAWIALLSFISSSVHIYFVLMCGIITVGVSLKHFLETKKVISSLGIPLFYILVSSIVIWLLGGFSSGMDMQNEGLGVYSFNLNGFFNPQGWSCCPTAHCGRR